MWWVEWWWNEDVAEAVREKKIMYGKWKKENTKEARKEYKRSKQNLLVFPAFSAIFFHKNLPLFSYTMHIAFSFAIQLLVSFSE